MRLQGDGNNCWPTPQQELLLRATLGHGEDARRAWLAWKSTADIARLDVASNRLLPLLYRNLLAQNIEDPLMDHLKAAYRRQWYKNQVAFRHMAGMLCSFHNAGIKTLILKGAPLVLLYYRDHGVRPMADIDVLVPVEQALPAVDLLKRLGWKRADRWPERFHESYISVGNATGFIDSSSQQLDLHWHVMPECCQPDADESFWSGAVATRIHDVPTLTLNSSDHLLHVCTHGLRWDPLPPFRWVADAMAIINADAELDWDRLAAQARKRRLLWPIKEALRYLRHRFAAPVPDGALRVIENTPTAAIDRVEYRYKSVRHRKNPFGYLPVHWFNYVRLENGVGSEPGVIGFARYLQRLCGVESLPRLVAYGAGRRMRRIWRYKDRGAARAGETR